MPMDPDDLLIFKVRRKGPAEQPNAQQEPAEPKPEQPKPQPAPQKPQQPEIQLPRMEPKSPQVLLKLFPQNKPKPQSQQKPQPTGQPAAAASQPKASAKLEAPTEAPKVNVPVPKETPHVVASASYSDVEEAIKAALGTGQKNTLLHDSKRESKAGAESKASVYGMFCVWHPWRPAFAACGYCHRPFCLEDTANFDGNYYCLEDIDKVASKPIESLSGQYNMLSMISALLLFCSFFLFIYYNGGSTAAALYSITGNASKVGAIGALYSISSQDIYAIVGPALIILGVASGILILMRAQLSFIFSIAVSLIIAFFFSYMYIASSEAYYLIYPAVTLLALALLVVSKNFTLGREDAETPHTIEQLGWANTGKF